MDHPSNNPAQVQVVTHNLPPALQRPVYVTRPYGLEPPDDADSEVGLFQYWEILRRNARTILLASLAGLILGFCIGLPMKSIYRASTTVEVLAVNTDFLNMKGATPVNNSTDSDVSEEQTQAALLSSATLIKRVAIRLSPPAPQPSAASPSAPTPAWKSLLHLASRTPVNARAVLVGKAASTLKVHPNPHTRILEATIESADPQLAADFLNTLSEEFIRQNQESHLTTSARTGDWLTHELGEARNQLRKAEDALQAYAGSSGIIYTNDSTNVATERLQQYQQSLSAATADRIAKQSRFELAQSSAPDSLADVLNDATLRDTQAKINDLKRQIADLSTIYNPEYAKLRRLQAELTTVQSALDSQRTEILSRIKTDYQESVRKERLLASTYNDQTREVTGQGEKSIQYNILKREVDSNRVLYDTMLQQMKQASIAAAMNASNVRVVDPAEAPAIPVFPNYRLNAILGMLGGLILSSVIVLVRDQMDRTLQSPGEIRQWLDLPELGIIPNASASEKLYYQGYGSNRYLRSSRPKAALSDAAAGNSLALDAWQKRPTMLAESFRSALASILFVGENGSRPRVLVFSSAGAAEGKTTAVSNLALAAAEIRLKVLVIDADLRRPQLHNLFNLANHRGLSDLLQADLADPTAPFTGIIQQTSIPNLHLLTAGPENPVAAHLLYSSNFADLIASFRTEYEMILIDTPPMLQMPDARIIARHADAVVLIARADQTSRDALLAAKERFTEDRITILGSLLNDWSPDRRARHYYSPN